MTSKRAADLSPDRYRDRGDKARFFLVFNAICSS